MLLWEVLAEYAPDIVVGFSGVYRDWLVEANSVLELTNEHLLLLVPRGTVIMVV